MTTHFAIVRVSKIKDTAALAGHSGHVLRTIPTPNANASHPHGVVRLFGDADPRATVEGALAALDKPPRKGGVLALEVLLTASPGWLREGLPPGQYHPDRVQALAEAAREWAAKTFPDCPMVAHLHLDESTPHIHLTVAPVDRTASAKGRAASARLNAARWIDGPAKLRAIQDSWAEALAPHGLTRGKASDRRHEKVQTLYRDLETDRALAAKVLTTTKKTAARILETAGDDARTIREASVTEAQNRRAAVETAAGQYIAKTKREAAALLARASEEAQADREAAAADRQAAAADRQAAAAERRAAEAERAEARRLRDYLAALIEQASALRTFLTDAGRLAAARLKTQIDRAPGSPKRDNQR